jgi:hypothetical protein
MAALNLLTVGLRSPANKANDLLDTFTEYSTAFRQLGISGPQALGLLNQGIGGAARNADVVADALKEFVILSQEATDAATPAGQAFATLGINAQEMATKFATGGPEAAAALQLITDKLRGVEDPALRSQLAVQLFGTKAEDLQQAIFSFDLSTAAEQVGNVEGAMNNASTATDTNKSKIEAWRRSMEENVVNFLAESVHPKLEELWGDWNKTGTFAGDLHNGLNELGDGFIALKNEGIDPVWGSLQTLMGWLGDAIEKVEEFLNSGIGTFLKDAGQGAMGAPGLVTKLLGFDDGGVVPGPKGKSRMIMAHGGEAFLPLHKMGLEDALTSAFGEKWVTYEDGSQGIQRQDTAGNWYGVKPTSAESDLKAGMDFAALGWPEEDVRAIADLIAAQRGGATPQPGVNVNFYGPVSGEQDFVQRMRSGNLQAARIGRSW